MCTLCTDLRRGRRRRAIRISQLGIIFKCGNYLDAEISIVIRDHVRRLYSLGDGVFFPSFSANVIRIFYLLFILFFFYSIFLHHHHFYSSRLSLLYFHDDVERQQSIWDCGGVVSARCTYHELIVRLQPCIIVVCENFISSLFDIVNFAKKFDM